MQYHPKSSAECYMFGYSWWAQAEASVLMAEGIYSIPYHSANICLGELLSGEHHPKNGTVNH